MRKIRRCLFCALSLVSAICVSVGTLLMLPGKAKAAKEESPIANGTVMTENAYNNAGFEDAQSADWWEKWQPWDTDNLAVNIKNDGAKAYKGNGYLECVPGNGGTRLARYNKIANFTDGVYRLSFRIAFEDAENIGAVAFIVRELSGYSSKDFKYYTDLPDARASGEYGVLSFSFKVATNADGSHSIYSTGKEQCDAKVDLSTSCEGFGLAMYVQNTSAYRIDEMYLSKVADDVANDNGYNLIEKGSFESVGEIPAGINQWGWDSWYYSDNATGSEISLSDELAFDGSRSMKISNVYTDKSTIWGIGLQYIMNSDKLEEAEYDFSAAVSSDKSMTKPSIGISILKDDQTIFKTLNDGIVSGYVQTTANEFTHIGFSFNVEKVGANTIIKIGELSESFNAGQQIRFQIYFGGGDNGEDNKRADYIDYVNLINKTAQEKVVEPDYSKFNNIINPSFEPENLISNPSFEEGSSLTLGGWGNWVNWFCDYNGTNSEFAASEDKAHSGEKSLRVSGVYSNKSDVWGVGIMYAVNGDLISDGDYKFSFWKASDKPASSVIGITVKLYDKTDAEKASWDLGYSDINAAFTKTEFSFVVSSEEGKVVVGVGDRVCEMTSLGQLRIQIYFGGGDNNEDNKRTDYLDDVSLVKAGANPVGTELAWNGWFCDYNGTDSQFAVSDEKVNSGSQALKITNVYSDKSSVWGVGIIYSIYAPEMFYDGNYEYSFYVASDKSASGVIGVNFLVYDGSYKENQLDLGYSDISTEWARRLIAFSVFSDDKGVHITSGTNSLTVDTMTQLRIKIYFGGGDNGADNKRTDYLDDVSLIKKAEFISWEENEGSNLVDNSSFESLESISTEFSWGNWWQMSDMNGAYASVSEDIFANGTKSLKIASADKVDGNIYYNEQPARLGFGEYTLSFYVALSDVKKLEAIVPYLLLNGLSENKVELGLVTSVAAVNGMFVKLEYDFIIDRAYSDGMNCSVTYKSGDKEVSVNNEYNQFRLGIYLKGETDFYIDCIKIDKTKNAEAAYPGGNLALNGDFESESQDYFSDKNQFSSGKWTVNSVSDTIASSFVEGREGGKALKLSGRNAEWNAVKYTVPALWIEPEKTYRVNAYVNLSAPAYICLIADMNDNSVFIAKQAVNANEWTKVGDWVKISYDGLGYVTVMTASDTIKLPTKTVGDLRIYVQTYDYPDGAAVENSDKNCDITIDDFSMKAVDGSATIEIPETWTKIQSDFTNRQTNTLWTSYYGEWTTADGVFEQTNDAFDAFDAWNRASYFRYGYNDFYFEYTMKINKTVSSGWAGVNFAKAKTETELASGHGYQFVARADRLSFVYEWIYDEEKQEYTYRDLATLNIASTTTDYVKYAIKIENKVLTIWADGIEITSVILDNYDGGYMTLITGGCTASFKDVTVYGIATKDALEGADKPYKPNVRDDTAEICIAHSDENSDGVCDVCGKKLHDVTTVASGCASNAEGKYVTALLCLVSALICMEKRREKI